MTINPILVDKRNFHLIAQQIVDELAACEFAGIDIETQDEARHAGINAYCKYNPDTLKKAGNTKLVFDVAATVITGFSIYPENSQNAYYVNLAHADVENRLDWSLAKVLVDALPEGSHWIAHNLNYELTMFRAALDLLLPRGICTMQMAVSAFGPDEYDHNDFLGAGQGGIKALLPDLRRQAVHFDPAQPRKSPKPLMELMGKITAKESSAEHSYNGFVKDISYSYGLKKLVRKFFHHQMTTFDQVLGDKAHMGQLTGEEVVAYGADDAYWALRLFRHLMDYMVVNCPTAIPTFFAQENPMVAMYSDMWLNGMKVNMPAILTRRASERSENAAVLRRLKAHLKTMLPFPDELNAKLAKADSWYAKNGEKYRQQIIDFAMSEPADDDFEQCYQVRGPVGNAWAAELGKRESTGVNLTHYMPARTMIYDLTQQDPIITMGKTQSDGEARGKLKEMFEERGYEAGVVLIDCLNELAGIDQRMKLYLTPYSQLMDPLTGKMHPTVSSMLASRRMAASTPNPMQLAKRGESTYVRGFFEADYEDHVIISVDWSGIELVEIGEFSGDPEFIKAFGQIPHEDLHGGAAADILAADVPGLTEDILRQTKVLEHEDDFRKEFSNHLGNVNRIFTDLKGQTLEIGKVWKYWRTEIGKGANFNYWYSGFLGTVGDRMGWEMEKTSKATDKYRQRFEVAEAWRVGLINEGRERGRVTLPDGHQRVRFEATDMFVEQFAAKFIMDNYQNDDMIQRYNGMWFYIAKQIQKRAFNQIVNSVVQGSCATIAKRSVLGIEKKKAAAGWTDREMRFMLPVHDELLYSVHRSLVPEAVNLIRGTMIDHPDMFTKCKLDASPAVGLTFEPWNSKKAPFGQIELYELPKLDFIPEASWDKRATDDQMREVTDYLFAQRKAA